MPAGSPAITQMRLPRWRRRARLAFAMLRRLSRATRRRRRPRALRAGDHESQCFIGNDLGCASVFYSKAGRQFERLTYAPAQGRCLKSAAQGRSSSSTVEFRLSLCRKAHCLTLLLLLCCSPLKPQARTRSPEFNPWRREPEEAAAEAELEAQRSVPAPAAGKPAAVSAAMHAGECSPTPWFLSHRDAVCRNRLPAQLQFPGLSTGTQALSLLPQCCPADTRGVERSANPAVELESPLMPPPPVQQQPGGLLPLLAPPMSAPLLADVPVVEVNMHSARRSLHLLLVLTADCFAY